MKVFSKLLLGVCALLILGVAGCAKDEVETTGIIYGNVDDAITAEPIGGATVTLSPGGKTTSTGSDGRFEFTNLEPKQYKIQISRTGYNTNTKIITVVAGSQEVGDLQLTPVEINQ